MKCLKAAFVYVLALIVGSYVAYSVGAIAFFSTTQMNIMPFAMPLGLAAMGAGVLTFFSPARSKSISLCVSLPMVCIAGFMQIGLAGEGRWWGVVSWIYLEAMVVAVSFFAAGYTQKFTRK